MTENKRFYIGNGENRAICDSSKGGSDFFNMLTQYEAVDRLNELFDENEQLKTYKKKVAKAFKVAINETTLTEQTENSLRTISKILEVDLE